ncbi:MAG TPA: TadG family pilus assembly protein [Hyphomonas sp.]|nr:TadG family pilus assembly protein [Hyphomonas sp.]
MAGKAAWRRRAERGNVSLIFALLSPVILVLLAFVVDIAAVDLKKREFQGATDLAAILSAQNLSDYENVALLNLAANGFSTRSVDTGGAASDADLPRTKALVETGTYVADPDIPPAERFVPGDQSVNAVRVTASYDGELFFAARLAAPPQLIARSVAYVSSQAAFSIGTRLARVEGGLANDILNALLGTNVSLSVMDYEALLAADAALFQTLDTLNTEASLSAVTYGDVLQSDVTLAQLAQACASGMPAGDPARNALSRIAADSGARNTSFRLGEIIDLGTLSPSRLGTIDGPYAARVRALDLLAASAALANGEHQVTLDLGADIPGIAGIHAALLVGERPQFSPWLSLTDLETTNVRTMQTRLLVEADVDGLSALAGTRVHLPVYLELAAASARLANVSCPGGREDNGTVDLLVTPSVARLRIGEAEPDALVSFRKDKPIRPARLVDTPLLDVYGKASIDVGGRTPQLLRFTAADVTNGTIRTVSSKDLAASLTASLVGELDIRVKAAGLSLASPSQVQAALSTTLEPVAGEIDEILATVLSIAGVSVGEADVRVNGLYCRHAVLVQ